MQVDLDVTADYSTEGTNEVIHLARVCTADGIGDTNSIDTNLIHSLVNGQQVYEVGAEGVL